MSPDEFAARLRSCGVKPGARVLAAVSGGADSLALLFLLCSVRPVYPLQVVCAHAEHGLRGMESMEDARFVEQLCKRWDVPFYMEHLPVLAFSAEHGLGLEEAARILRYRFLGRIAKEENCSEIAAAHHRRDQAETLLLRMARGTDINGLRGMQRRRGLLIRPLLDDDPEELRRILERNSIPWREDRTNGDLAFQRNRIRLAVLPQLRMLNPSAEEALSRLAKAAERDEDYFSSRLRQLGLIPPVRLANGFALPAAPLRSVHPALAGRALRSLLEAAGFPPEERSISLALNVLRKPAEEQAMNLPHGGRLAVGRESVCATKTMKPLSGFSIRPGRNETPFGTVTLRRAAAAERCDGIRTQLVPGRKIQELQLMAREPGREMIPFGRQDTVPLRKLISSAGIELAMRMSIPLFEAGGEIFWLGGIRGAACCKDAEDPWMIEWEPPWIQIKERNAQDQQRQEDYKDGYQRGL